MWVSKEQTWRLCPTRQATPLAGSQPVQIIWWCQHNGSGCRTLVASCLRRIQSVLTYYLYRNLLKDDFLHTMQIGMLDHLQEWMFHFMKMHKRLNKYNPILLGVPAYDDLTPKNTLYEEVSQLNWKEMIEMSQYLIGVVTRPLRGGCPAQHPKNNHATQCAGALLEFYIYVRYKLHDNGILSYMEDTFCRFHTF